MKITIEQAANTMTEKQFVDFYIEQSYIHQFGEFKGIEEEKKIDPQMISACANNAIDIFEEINAENHNNLL